MKRWGRIAAWAAGLLIALPVLLVATVLIGGNTAPGLRLIAELTPKLTGGSVALQDLGGSFPEHLTAGHVELRDADGPYVAIDGLALDWHPLDLIHKTLRIDRLAVQHIAVTRLPASNGSASQSSSNLPVAIDIAHLDVAQLDLAAPVAGAAATLGISGSLHAASLNEARFDLTAKRSDALGDYALSGKIDTEAMQVHVTASEPAQGLLSEIAGLPDLGAISVTADLDGPRSAERVALVAKAGLLAAKATGQIDLVGQSLDLDIQATAPQMEPAPAMGWQSATLDAHAHGSFTAPDASGHLEIAGLHASGSSAERVLLDLAGNSGKLDLTGSVVALRVPGPQADLLAASPLAIKAEMVLADPTRPVSFTLSHPLLDAEGKAKTAPALSGDFTARIADLAPFAAIGGVDLAGNATITASVAQTGTATAIDATGTIGLTGGTPQAVAMIGDDGRFGVKATIDGDDITLDRFTLDGKRASTEMNGSAKQGVTDLDWRLTIADVAPLAPSLSGNVDAHGTVTGGMDDLAVTAEADGSLATEGFPRSALHVSLDAGGLPQHPHGHVTAHGTLDRAPLDLDLAVDRNDGGTLHATIDRASWRSLRASGDVTMPADALPVGKMQLKIGSLADLAPFIGTSAGGSLDASVDWLQQGKTSQARIRATADQIVVADTHVRRVTLDGTIDDPMARQVTALRLTADGIDANGLTGSAQLDANGPATTGLAVKLATQMQQGAQALKIDAGGQLAMIRHDFTLSTLAVSRGPQTVKLLAPARIAFGSVVAVDRLRLGIDRATMEIAGRLSPTLDASAAVRDIPVALANQFVPGLNARGTISGDAKLNGPLAAPDGTIHLTGSGIKLGSGPASALPPTAIQTTIQLKSGTARIDGKVNSGDRAQLTLSGQAPLDPNAPLDFKANGTVDLALLNPLLSADGRSVLGKLTLNAALSGTLAAPRASGTVQLADGDFQDYTQGVHISAIGAALQADGDTIRIQRFSGRAGSGSISVSGTVGVLAPGMPVAIDIEAKDARPLQSDLINAVMGGKLTIRGQASGQLALAGRLTVSHADITIPDKFPPSVAKLTVRIPGQRPPPPPTGPATSIGVDLTIDAPREIFVRGHGLDAEMGGSLRVTGDAGAPQILGGFDLRHGTLSLAGETLNFTSGRVSFEGDSVAGKLDPAINFVAQTVSGGVTASLTVSGYADKPVIALSSSPDLPQDEVLAHLLFGQSVKQLGPLQLAEIAEALASLSGAGFGNPLTAVRQGLGLDRLNLSGDGTNTGGTVEAGKYVANGVYVGAKQGTSGGTQAQVQVDITKHLKLETTVGTGGTPATGATPQNDAGSSVGLTYQFEY